MKARERWLPFKELFKKIYPSLIRKTLLDNVTRILQENLYKMKVSTPPYDH